MNKTSEKTSALDELFLRSAHYHNSENYMDTLEFISRLRNMAPFNAWLLHEQNPDITFVATAYDWAKRLDRSINVKARAYVILKPFGPVDFVYDVKDTTGDRLPTDLQAHFRAEGKLDNIYLSNTLNCCQKKGIQVFYDTSLYERQAGWATHAILNKSQQIVINSNHSKEVKFSTLCHELAHLMLGHLGTFSNCECDCRSHLPTNVKEVEAESVSWLVCKRLDISTNSDSYLSSYFGRDDQKILAQISIDKILTTAGRIEAMTLRNNCHINK